MAAATKKNEQRMFERFPIRVKASVDFDDAFVACTILNIGADGAKVQMFAKPAAQYLAQYTSITLNVPDFHGLPGKIVWTEEDSIGIAFDESHKVISRLIQSLP